MLHVIAPTLRLIYRLLFVPAVVAVLYFSSAALAVDYNYEADGVTRSWTVVPWDPAGTPGATDSVSVSATNTNSTININTAVALASFTKTGAAGLFLNAVNAPRTFTVESLLSVTEGTLTLRNQNSTNVLTLNTGAFTVGSGAQFVIGLTTTNTGRPVFTAAADSTNLVQGSVLVRGYNAAVQTTQPAVALGHLVLDGGTLDISSGNSGERTANTVNVSSLSSSGSGVRTVTAAESDGLTAVSTLVIGGLNTTAADFDGTINNNINVVKEGAGTQIFSGGNNVSYNGTTTVNGGVLEFAGMTTGVNTAITVNAGGTVRFNTTGSPTRSGVLSGAGAVVKSGAGTLALTGSNTLTGSLTVSGGVLSLDTDGASAAGAVSQVSVASGAVLLLARSDQVSDTAEVTLSGGTIRRAAGVGEVFGGLILTAASVLDFGGGSGAVVEFSGLDYTPSALLSLQLLNFTQGNSLVIRNTTDLSGEINSGFTFAGTGGFGASSFSEGTFTITAIPEPSSAVVAALLCGAGLWSCRRRRHQAPPGPS